ncbi:MAG: sigma 54-interacting transcriptional regulator, partial [Candidatus Cloacimonetes bacterium]|nr:sigma 54-interacting transcriptional regulator [Candidatus Cloacimonadota bacterium]
EFVQRYDEFLVQFGSDPNVRKLHLWYAASLLRLRRYEEAKAIALTRIVSAAKLNDNEELIRHYLLLAKCFFNTDEKHRIKACFEIAMDYGRKSSDRYLLAKVFLDYSAYQVYLQAYDKALNFLETAWKTVQNSDNNTLKIDILLGIGDVHYRNNNYKKALSNDTKAYELSLITGDKEQQIHLLDRLATLYDLTNKGDAATAMLDKALELCKDVPSKYFKIIYNYGTHNLRLDKAAEALKCFMEAEKATLKLGQLPVRFYCELYSNMAGCYWLMQNPNLTREYLDKALEIVARMDSPDLLIQTKLNQAHFLTLMGDYELSKQNIEEAIEHYTAQQNSSLLIKANQALISLHEKSGDFVAALNASKQNEKNYQLLIADLRAEMSSESESKMGSLNNRYESGSLGFQCMGKPAKTKTGCIFIGDSASSRKVLESALLAAQHPNANVFIYGESGTGKDVLANIIHYNSIRRDSPFVPINVSALSAGVLESELFGHVRGAFTGAINSTKGFLHKSHKGTLFLDEITEMPSELQSKLLRVVETHLFTPVGSSEEIPYDSRIISSTNRNINDAISTNAFRLDLFHRLNTIEIYIPPLRERREDIEELLMHYTEQYAEQNNLSIPRITDAFVRDLQHYSFPGNVRELKNLVERLFILCGYECWTDADLINLNVINHTRISDVKGWGNPEVERIIHALEQSRGKQKDAAKVLKISESTLCRRIAKFNLEAYTLRHRES